MSKMPSHIKLEKLESDLRKKEKELRRCEEQYQFVSELTSDFSYAYRVEANGEIINEWVTGAFERITGFTRKEIKAQGGWEKLIHPEDLQITIRQLATLFSNKSSTIKYRIIDKTEKIRWMKDFSKPIWDEKNNRLKKIYGAVQEITKQKKAEDELKQSEKKFRQIYDNILDVYYEASLDGMILEISPSIEKLSQYKREELIGKSLYDLYTNPSERDDLIEVLLNKGNATDYEISLSDKNGQEHICSLNVEFIKDDENNPEKIIGVCRDISDRKHAEDEKIKAQRIAAEHEKMALVGQVAGKMAHDFNNILGIVMGNAELAMIDCQDDETKKTLELIYNQTIHGKNLTKNLVAFAKDQEPKQEFFKIDEKMDLVIVLLKKDIEGIAVTREYGHNVPEILADPGMIEHAIVNLVQNSIHATSFVEQPQIIIRTYQQDEQIFIEIEDNGCGIPEEFLEEIFEPSFTLKGIKDKRGMYKSGIKGTGYGMSNVKKYVEQHKGFVSIHSELKKGTKVTISLPIIKKELSVKEIETIKKEEICFEKYILLVEDEQAISDVQYRILTHEPSNHKVDIASNGQVAIDLLKRNKYDFISLDYILSGGLSGMDVYHHIRETNKTIPILFISGNIEFLESIKDLKQKDLYIDHLSKPCMNIDYLNCVNKLLGKLTT